MDTGKEQAFSSWEGKGSHSHTHTLDATVGVLSWSLGSMMLFLFFLDVDYYYYYYYSPLRASLIPQKSHTDTENISHSPLLVSSLICRYERPWSVAIGET